MADVEASGATFEQEELVGLVGHGLEVPAAGGEGSEVVMAGGEHLAAAQPQQLVLQGSEFGRGALAAAFVHDRGPPQAARLPAAVRPVGVVEVGQAQDVAEFVAEDARAALGADREAVDPLAADGQRFAAVGGKPALLGPDGVLAPAVILADAGAEQEDVVDGAVGVVVIEGIVDLALPLRAGFADGFREVDILAVGIVGAVVGRLAGERRDGRQGEFEGGQAVELAVEILRGLPHREAVNGRSWNSTGRTIIRKTDSSRDSASITKIKVRRICQIPKLPFRTVGRGGPGLGFHPRLPRGGNRRRRHASCCG